MILPAGIAYFAVVFAAGCALGGMRVMVLAPAIGQLSAVALELPVILVLSWVVAGRVLRRWPLPRRGRLAMGGVAFALLIGAEAALALATGQTFAAFLAAMATPAGALGLAGQVAFGLLPALRITPRAAPVPRGARRTRRRWGRPRR